MKVFLVGLLGSLLLERCFQNVISKGLRREDFWNEKCFKTWKNEAQIHAKVLTIDPKCVLDAKKRQDVVLYRIFSIFGQFWEALGPPKMEPKSTKIKKIQYKNDVNKIHIFKWDFSLIFQFKVWASQNPWKIKAFYPLDFKRRFCGK